MRRWGRIAAFHWKNWRGLEGKAKPSYARETFRSQYVVGVTGGPAAFDDETAHALEAAAEGYEASP